MNETPYRQAGPARAVDRLAERGASLRAVSGVDPHAPRASTPVSGVRTTTWDRIAAFYGDIMLSSVAVKFTLWVLSLWGCVLMLFIYGVTRATGNPMLAPPLLVVVFVLVAALVARRRDAPRRWLAGRPFRVDGYLELRGREARVSRVLARVEFADDAPDPAYVGDVLTGAGCETRGVQRVGPRALALHSPAIDGDAAALHRWFQGLVDRALVPLDEVAPIRFIELQER